MLPVDFVVKPQIANMFDMFLFFWMYWQWFLYKVIYEVSEIF